jgi:ABC-type multidrug transport system fused ATPase/permease subunit
VASLRAHVALVDQSPWLGRGTVADAVRLGRPEASDERVAAALADAGLPPDSGLLARLPGGQNGRIGDGGGTVSGGERRRIALARALLRDAPVLLMDEPTSGLDPDTEAHFLATVRRVAAGRVILIVAHGQACARVADEVFLLEAGRLRSVHRRDGAKCA